MLDDRLSCPKQIQMETGENGRSFKNSNYPKQEFMQRSFYRTQKSLTPMVENSRSFENNLHSYANLKQIKNTIDMFPINNK